jgi:hypothetical protein
MACNVGKRVADFLDCIKRVRLTLRLGGEQFSIDLYLPGALVHRAKKILRVYLV